MGSSMGVPWAFHGRSLGVLWAFRERLVRAAHGQFHGRLMGVLWMLPMGSSMGEKVTMGVSRASHETPMGV